MADPQQPDFIPSEPDFIPLTADTLKAHVASQIPPEPNRPGFISSLGSDLFGMAKGLVTGTSNAFSGSPLRYSPGLNTAKPEADALAQQQAAGVQDRARAAAGYSVPYRIGAPVAQTLGVNVPGMEQSAQQGDVGGVLGHAAAVPTAIGLTAGAAKTLGAASDLVGLRTRAGQAFSSVESQIGDHPVEFQPVLKTAYKAAEMGAKGFTLPKVVNDFIEWSKAVQASQTPFRFADARDFYTALGEKIPWDQYGGKGGRMYQQIMAMRRQLGTSLEGTATQAGLGDQYTQALKDYRSASQITKGAKYAGSAVTLGPLGKAVGLSGGDLMAYLARKVVNAGAVPPESIAGSMVNSLSPKIPFPPEQLNAIREGGAETRRSSAQFVQDVIRRQGLPTDPSMADIEAAVKGRAAEMAQKYPVPQYQSLRDPFAPPPTPADVYNPQVVQQHASAMEQAKSELGGNASLSEILQRAARIQRGGQ